MSAMYRLFLLSIGRRSRLLTLGGLGALAVLLGVVVGLGDDPDRGAQFVNGFGLVLTVPIASLIFASAVFGDTLEDRTLVYLWLKPVARWRIVLAAAAAAITIALPMIGIPLVIAAIAAGGGGDLVVATALASAVGVAAYTGIFTYLGLRLRRSLIWGLAYILIWEGFIARAGKNASRFAIRGHTRSILARITDTDFELADFGIAYAIVVPLLVMAAALAMASLRLARQDID